MTFYLVPIKKVLVKTFYTVDTSINQYIFSNIHIQALFLADHYINHDQTLPCSKTFDGGRSNAVNHLSFRVDILEKRYLVKRTRIGNDRCKIHLEVTDAGVEFIQNAPIPLQLRFFNRLKDLDEKQFSMILWSLEMLVDMLGDGIGPMDILTHLTLSQLVKT